jgi:hypothetical protein
MLRFTVASATAPRPGAPSDDPGVDGLDIETLHAQIGG